MPHLAGQKRIIDAHAHIFPQKIAEKAVASIGSFYGLEMHDAGTSDALIQSGEKIGVEKYLVCSTATKPEQVTAINDFIFEECKLHPEFVGFATLHPEMEHMEREVERILERGYYGIKLHPDFQEFKIDDPRAMEMYRLAEGKLVILFHTGDSRYEFSTPRRLAKIGEKFPQLRCIGAHFGGYSEWEEAYEVYDNPNIYMDTSSSLFTLAPEMACRFIEKFGADHFFFGTDFPMWTHQAELARFEKLALPENIQQMILADNFDNAVIQYRNR